MGSSRASKEQMGMACGMAAKKSGGDVGHWIQDAHVKKGALHSALHVAPGKRIPEKKLDKALHSKNEHMRKMAQFAENVRH
jgi:hypothetical protein